VADNFEELEVWQVSMDLAVAIPDLALKFPSEFRWLARQVMDSSESVPSNIAEGFERRLNGDFVRFLRIAKASLGETVSHLVYARRRRLIPADDYDRSAEQCLRVKKMLASLIAYLVKHPKKPDAGNQSGER
jgi:four helix bundle protein